MPYAKTTCIVAGFRETVQAGKSYADNHPIVVAYPGLFEDEEAHRRRTAKPSSTADLPAWRAANDRMVERATAAPGEKRNARRAKKDDTKS